MNRREQAAYWEDGIAAAVGGLQARLESDDIDLDYSEQSLAAIEALAVQSFPTSTALFDAADRPLVRALLAYIGLSFTHLSAGHWDWDDEPGFAERGLPAVSDPNLLAGISSEHWGWDHQPGNPAGIPLALPGPGLTVSAVSPLHLLLTVVDRRADSNGPLVQEFSKWSSQVVNPPTQGVPGIDVYPTPPPSAELDGWLAQRRREFHDWTGRYPGRWDFSADSIEQLTTDLLQRIPDVESLKSPDNRDFVEGASWYLGELLRRAAPSRWVFRDFANLVRVGLAYADDPDLVQYDIQLADNSETTTPYYLLQLGVKSAGSKLRKSFGNWLTYADPDS